MDRYKCIELNKRIFKETAIIVFRDKRFILCTRNKSTIMLLSNDIKFDSIEYSGFIEVADLVKEEARLINVNNLIDVCYLGVIEKQAELDKLIKISLSERYIYK